MQCRGAARDVLEENDSMNDFPLGATTLHLLPAEIWAGFEDAELYTPEAFAADGFVHCTNGDDELVSAGNRYYASDPRSFLALTIAIDRLISPIRYDDPARTFPHIYGPVNRAAIVARRSVMRDAAGAFVAIADDEVAL
jgi:uncharacterized protein (DUF952 family)